MKLSPKQIEYVNRERDVLIRVIRAKERDKVYSGLGGDQMRLRMIQTIIELHNLEVEVKINDQRNSVSPENQNSSYILSFGC